MRRAGIAFGALVLGLGPWIGLFHQAPRTRQLESAWYPAAARPIGTHLDPAIRPAVPPRTFANDGCTCQTVEINADNFVRDAKVRTGDARVVNVNVTYVSPDFVQNGDAKIDVDQEAEAQSGDAIAGQILSVVAHAAGSCTHVIVNATNDVADAKVRSGDARAINRNFVLLDPAVDRSSVDIDVNQRAHAKSGEAIAGQILGVLNRGGPCGGVDVNASNSVKDVKLRTGESRAQNENEITQCETSGCIKELWLLVRHQHLDGARICDADGCTMVSAAELHDMYHAMKAAEDAADGPAPTPRPKHHKDDPTPTPSESPSDGTTSTEPTPTPTPTPTPDGSVLAAPAG